MGIFHHDNRASAVFLLCQTIPQQYPACRDTDLDYDGDVDQNDFSVFQGCMNGPNNPPG